MHAKWQVLVLRLGTKQSNGNRLWRKCGVSSLRVSPVLTLPNSFTAHAHTDCSN